MNPTIQFKDCAVLQAESRSYTAKDGNARTYRDVMFRYAGKIFKLGLTSKADFEAVKEKEGEVCTLTVELSTFGDNLKPDLRVSEVE